MQVVNGISEVVKVEGNLVELELATEKKEEQKVETKAEEPKIAPKVEQKKPAVKKSSPKKEMKKTHQSVRVDLERIDNLMNMVSELVIYRTRLEQIVVSHKSPELNETLEQVGRTTSDLQDLVMKIRMLPLDLSLIHIYRTLQGNSINS